MGVAKTCQIFVTASDSTTTTDMPSNKATKLYYSLIVQHDTIMQL